MPINLPESKKPRIVIAGAGFGGLTLARKLAGSGYQIVIVDKNNFHQFQPLNYQVAMAGLEPSAISFPLRKMFQRKQDVYIRMADIRRVDLEKKCMHTNHGHVNYDLLVLAMGVRTNYFGNEKIRKHSYAMKTVADALFLRNAILSDLEVALTERDFYKRQERIDIVIVGGGPTGVELAGALAEMKKYILPKDYRELDSNEVDIHLIQGGERLLAGMSENASRKSEEYLTQLGVHVRTGVRVVDVNGKIVKLNDGSEILCRKVIWAAGVRGIRIPGIPEECYCYGDRIRVNRDHKVPGLDDIYVIGDQACMEEPAFPKGHPQVAQGAIQHARSLAKNLKRTQKKKKKNDFSYKDLGTLATIGRNRAVADLPGMKFQGFIAWLLWGFVHLKSILGTKNKIFVLVDWMWNYVTYDQSLRIIIKHRVDEDESE